MVFALAIVASVAVALAGPTRFARGASRTSPNLISALAPLVPQATPMVAVGGDHTCALNAAGGVRCWGRNVFGQVGDGTTTDRPRATNVTGLDSGVVAIAAGSAHTCALTSGGGVKCWGDNADGELGDFTQVDRSTPVDVIGLTSGVVAIAAGDLHTCALLTGGGVECWGHNYYGELGNGTSGNSWLGAVPVCTSGGGFGCTGGSALSGVSSISVGGINTCAVTTTHALLCWGGNYNGQLGQGFAPDKPIPDANICPTSAVANASCVSLPVGVPGLGSGVTAATAGDTTCALSTTGGVECWGFNAHGEVGNGTISPPNPNVNTNLYSPSYPEPDPVAVTGLTSGVAAIADPCALTSTGGVKCWGDNAFGELGDGTSSFRTTPVDVSGLTSGVTQISSQAATACAEATGVLKCWGSNLSGQLGATTSETCFGLFNFPCSTVPVDVGSGPELFVSNIKFEEQEYPSGNVITVPAGGAVDGNQVTVTATIGNVGNGSHNVQVRFLDGETDAALPNNAVDVVVPAASLVSVTYSWDTTGFAWTSGATHTARKVKAIVVENAQTKASGVHAVKIMPKPVVLVHGFVSGAETWGTYYGFLDTVVPGWRAFAVGDQQVPGVMNTGFLSNPLIPTNTISQNAFILGQYIEGVRQQTNAWHVDVVAHSMGGLITRDYIQDFMPADAYGSPVLSHLVMLGTPNRGTNCALVGSAVPFPAVLQLRNDYIDLVFNNQVTNRRGVPFSILEGNKLPFTCFAPVAGDGVVSQISASWNLADIGVGNLLHTSMTSSQNVFTTFVLPHLAVSAATVQAAAATSLHLASPPLDEVTTPIQFIADGSAAVGAGGSADVSISVPAGSAFDVSLMALPDVSATLIDPTSVTVTSILAGSPEAAEPYRSFHIGAPATGTWTLRLANVGSGGATIPYSASIEGSTVAFSLQFATPGPNGNTPVSASLKDGALPITGATVTGVVTGVDGSHAPFTLFDDGLHNDGAASDGGYGMASGALATGVYDVTVHAVSPGISRFAKGTLDVVAVATTPTPTNTATPSAIPTNTDTPTPSPTETDTPTIAPTSTATPTGTPTRTPTVLVPGATFTVGTTNDATDASLGDGVCASAAAECTLRAAIMEANAHTGSDTIVVPSGTYKLALTGPDEEAGATGDLDITGDVTILGAGAATTIIDGNAGNPRDRVFHIHGVAGAPQVEIDGVTITGGALVANGGGILNDHASLTLRRDEVRSNFASDFGGGIDNNGGSAVIEQSTIDGNGVSFNGDGGGIANVGSSTLSLTNDTVSNNHAFIGGGILNFGGYASLRNVTVSLNFYTGGGEGGGVENFAGVMDVANTIIAGNHFNCGRGFTSLGHNLDDDSTCGLSGPGDISASRLRSVDALLGPLQDNGGGTRTFALLPGSPATDAGDSALCPLTDQRGMSRPQDGDANGTAICDIGAFEAQTQTPAATATQTATMTAVATATDTPTASPTSTNIATATHTSTPTASATSTPTATETPVPTSTDTPTPSATVTSSATPTATATSSPTSTKTPTWSPTTTSTPTATSSSTPLATLTLAPTASSTATPSATPTATPSTTSTVTPLATSTPTTTRTPTVTSTRTATSTTTPLATVSAVPTATNTPAQSRTPGATRSSVPTRTVVATRTAVPTATRTDAPRHCGDDAQAGRERSHDLVAIAMAWARGSHDARYDVNSDGRIDLHDVVAALRASRCEHRRGEPHHDDD